MYRLILTTIVSFSLFNSCNTKTANSTSNHNANDSTLPPVETRSPNTNYKPAFSGQTRIGGVKTSTAYEGKIINSSLVD